MTNDRRIFASTPWRRCRIAARLACGLFALWVFAAAVPRVLAQPSPRPAGWSEATHGRGGRPDYGRLFAMDRVHEIRISLTAENFRAMQEDLKTVTPPMPGPMPGFGPPPPGGAGGAPPFAALMEAAASACVEKEASAACSAGGVTGQCTSMFGGPLMCVPAEFAAVMAGGGPMNLTTRDPMYVPVTVTHDGRVWTKVGMRHKGNSSLMAANANGTGKVPFRLDFDRYEDDFPEVKNQRFYGFQKLTFSSNFSDDSQLREILASEVLRDRGVPAPRAAFYRVVVDAGAGPEYWGLYTMVEDPADGAMLEAQFGGRGGNLYKPDGPGADWTRFDPEGFEKKTNEKVADFSDVEAALAALHAPRTDPQAWRTALEARFDVDGFLRWLAVSTAIENWDAYGVMPHNYYLYGEPASGGRLRWIPWDHNMSFGAGPFGAGGGFPGGAGPFGGRGRGGVGGGPPMPGPPMPAFGPSNDVLHAQVGDRWPLIQRLLADEVYAGRYRTHLEQATGGLLAPEAFARRARELHELIAPSILGDRGERPTHTTISSPTAFEQATDGTNGLLEIVTRRRELIRTTLAAGTSR